MVPAAVVAKGAAEDPKNVLLAPEVTDFPVWYPKNVPFVAVVIADPAV